MLFVLVNSLNLEGFFHHNLPAPYRALCLFEMLHTIWFKFEILHDC
jgi:hypothetical protein